MKIHGTFFEFHHHNSDEGKYWNPAIDRFTEKDWRAKVREIASAGMEYIVVMATALYEKCYFQSAVYPFADIPCDDPIEVVLDEADQCNVRVFLGNGFFGDWKKASRNIVDEGVISRSFRAMEELAALYAHHPSFYGWYFPDEIKITETFSQNFVKYVNRCSAHCHALTPHKRTLIAPYGTRLVKADDAYVQQLAQLDVDFIAYQDEVGVRKSKVEDTRALFEALKKAHDAAGRAQLWADVEIFDFEGDVYKSALIPAPADRVKRQLENVAPFVDKILVYQYLGLMTPTTFERLMPSRLLRKNNQNEE